MSDDKKMLTPADLEDAVRALAAEHPDFVYQGEPPDEDSPMCSYFPDERNPLGCIIGAAVRRCGLEANNAFEGEDACALLAGQFGWDGGDAGWFKLVQRRQDRGENWSKAVASADGAYQ